jgi:hypothetical protein
MSIRVWDDKRLGLRRSVRIISHHFVKHTSFTLHIDNVQNILMDTRLKYPAQITYFRSQKSPSKYPDVLAVGEAVIGSKSDSRVRPDLLRSSTDHSIPSTLAKVPTCLNV